MAFNLSGQFSRLKDNQSQWVTIGYYLSVALVIVTVFCYVIFSFKVYLQNQQIDDINQKILSSTSGKNKLDEQRVTTYKKKLDDFASIINNHRISLNIFDFIESKTLPDVWFSGFNVAEAAGTINFSGTAKNMEALSAQMKVFETSRDAITNIGLLSSQSAADGKVTFTLSISFNPSIFNYHAKATPGASTSADNTGVQATTDNTSTDATAAATTIESTGP